MFNLSHLFNWIKTLRQQHKAKKRRAKPVRSIAEFKKKYPHYKIGNKCYGLPVVKHPHEKATLNIGTYCSFAENVQIFMGGMHHTDWVTTYLFPAYEENCQHIDNWALTNGNVTIGNDVWLCANCIILSGVTIGNGAVIANGAIVTKDVPPYAIVAGNPAKLIRWRFDEATRDALQASAWWNWPEQELLNIVDKLCSEKIQDFLAYAKNRNQQK